MKYSLIICWVILIMYLSLNIMVGYYPTDKEAYSNISSHEYADVKEEREENILYRAQKLLLPVWRFNRYIYSALFLMCILSTYMFWRMRKATKLRLKNNS